MYKLNKGQIAVPLIQPYFPNLSLNFRIWVPKHIFLYIILQYCISGLYGCKENESSWTGL